MWRVVDGAAVIVHADTSAYYSLNATGTAIWAALCDTGATASELVESLQERYERDAAQLASELDAFLGALAREDLVELGESADPSASNGSVRLGPGEPEYHPPTVEHFGELEKLILSGE